MKQSAAIASLFTLGIVLGICGCSTFGRNPSPPTTLETKIFDVHTSSIPVLVFTTNVIPTTIYLTNTQGVTSYLTNVQLVTQTITNQVSYQYTPGVGAQTATGVVGAVGSLFGVGGMAGTGLAALLALWAKLRSSKNYATAANTAQVVETLREFVKSLPNGQKYDTALTQFMTAHQAESGVVNEVLGLLENEVSNPDAKQAAAEIVSTINALSGTTPIPPRVG